MEQKAPGTPRAQACDSGPYPAAEISSANPINPSDAITADNHFFLFSAFLTMGQCFKSVTTAGNEEKQWRLREIKVSQKQLSASFPKEGTSNMSFKVDEIPHRCCCEIWKILIKRNLTKSDLSLRNRFLKNVYKIKLRNSVHKICNRVWSTYRNRSELDHY